MWYRMDRRTPKDVTCHRSTKSPAAGVTSLVSEDELCLSLTMENPGRNSFVQVRWQADPDRADAVRVSVLLLVARGWLAILTFALSPLLRDLADGRLDGVADELPRRGVSIPIRVLRFVCSFRLDRFASDLLRWLFLAHGHPLWLTERSTLAQVSTAEQGL